MVVRQLCHTTYSVSSADDDDDDSQKLNSAVNRAMFSSDQENID